MGSGATKRKEEKEEKEEKGIIEVRSNHRLIIAMNIPGRFRLT